MDNKDIFTKNDFVFPSFKSAKFYDYDCNLGEKQALCNVFGTYLVKEIDGIIYYKFFSKDYALMDGPIDAESLRRLSQFLKHAYFELISFKEYNPKIESCDDSFKWRVLPEDSEIIGKEEKRVNLEWVNKGLEAQYLLNWDTVDL